MIPDEKFDQLLENLPREWCVADYLAQKLKMPKYTLLAMLNVLRKRELVEYKKVNFKHPGSNQGKTGMWRKL